MLQFEIATEHPVYEVLSSWELRKAATSAREIFSDKLRSLDGKFSLKDPVAGPSMKALGRTIVQSNPLALIRFSCSS
jgi:hypothetical protein